MKRWENSTRLWSGPLFPLLIMQLIVCAGMVIVNGWGLIIREFDPVRLVFVVSFGLLLLWWLATLVGVARLRASERRALTDAGQDDAGSFHQHEA